MSLTHDESTLHGWIRERVTLMRELGIRELDHGGLTIVLDPAPPAQCRPKKATTKRTSKE